MATRLATARRENVLILTLESDDGYPRLELPSLENLAGIIATFHASPELAGAVITGTNQAFAVGADIAEIAALSAAEAQEFAQKGQRVYDAIANLHKPILAAIRGYCMGGGFDLALACHARIATPDAVFAHPGGALGIMTGWGGTQRLTRLIGRSRALDMLMTGRRVLANEALQCGLVNAVVSPEQLLAEALRCAAIPRHGASD